MQENPFSRTARSGRGPLGRLFGLSVAAAMSFALLPAEAQAQYASGAVQSALRSAAGSDRDLRAFYAAQGYRPLWVHGDMLSPAADRFLKIVETAEHDGLDPGDYRARALASAKCCFRAPSPTMCVMFARLARSA
jgi:hypothetical protein